MTLALAACERTETRYVPSPSLEPDDGAVIFLMPGLAALAVARADVEDGAIRFPLTNPADPLLLTALVYPHTLARLELLAGPIAEGSPRSCLLAAPSAVYDAAISDGHASRWTRRPGALSESTRAEVLGSRICVPPNLCRTFDARAHTLDTVANVEVLVALDDEAALVGDIHGRFDRATRDRVTRLPALDGLPSRSGFRAADGRIWLGGSEGALTRGTIDDGFEPVEVPLSIRSIRAIGESPRGELLLIASDRHDEEAEIGDIHLVHYDGVRFRVVYEGIDVGIRPNQSAVLWRDDAVAYVAYGGATILRYASGEVEHRDAERALPIQPSFNGLAWVEGMGLVAAGGDGFLYSSENTLDARLQARSGVVLGKAIETVASIYGGAFFGGTGGTLGQHYASAQPCDAGAIVRSDVEEMVQMGRDLLVGGGSYDQSALNQVTWLIPRE